VIASLIDTAEGSNAGDQAVAINLAVADINGAGGVLGSEVRLLSGEYSGDADLVLTADQLVDDGARVLVGPSDSLDVTATLAAVRGREVVVISPTDFLPRDPSDDPPYFRTSAPGSLIGIGAASLIPEDAGSAVMLVEASPDVITAAIANVVQNALEERGLTVQVVRATTDFDAVAAQVRAASPGAMRIIGLEPSAELYQEMIDRGYGPRDVPIVVVNDNPGAPGLARGAIEGITGILPNYRTGEALTERLPAVELSHRAAQAYDAVIIAALAAEASGSTDASAIAAMIPAVTGGGAQCFDFAGCAALLGDGEDIDYEGPGGPYDIDESGAPTAGLYRVSTVDATGLAGPATTVDVTVRFPE